MSQIKHELQYALDHADEFDAVIVVGVRPGENYLSTAIGFADESPRTIGLLNLGLDLAKGRIASHVTRGTVKP